MRLATVLFSLLCACASVSGAPSADPPQVSAALVVARSAGDVSGSRTPGIPDVTALRAEGPPALARLLAEYDRTGAEGARVALAAMIDKVAGQRYATVSRLYWYDDLARAQAVARATGKPILSLRMLGRLDEDLSCANSRFFRTTLYPDAAVASLLRERFVLHWSSERNVPRVTVDFGDGRKLESTVTGNSAHYILDADGRPIDVLPGLYAPQVFVRELQAAEKLHASLQGLDDRRRAEHLGRHHQQALDAARQRFAALPAIPIMPGARGLLTNASVASAAASAQRATMSKAYVEVPMLRTVELGVDPGTLPADIELWAEIGQHLLGVGAPPDVAAAAAVATSPFVMMAPPAAPAKRKRAAEPRPILDRNSRALVDAMLAEPAAGQTLDAAARAAVIARLEQTIVADTALNEMRLRQQIRGYLANALGRGTNLDFAQLNAYVYEQVFHTPAGDAWMGLLPRDTFTGLPAGAVISRS